MTKTEDGKFTVNYKYRYLAEDVPCGILPIRGIATIAGVYTPYMDMVINWCQGIMGKEYLKVCTGNYGKRNT